MSGRYVATSRSQIELAIVHELQCRNGGEHFRDRTDPKQRARRVDGVSGIEPGFTESAQKRHLPVMHDDQRGAQDVLLCHQPRDDDIEQRGDLTDLFSVYGLARASIATAHASHTTHDNERLHTTQEEAVIGSVPEVLRSMHRRQRLSPRGRADWHDRCTHGAAEESRCQRRRERARFRENS